MLQFGHYMKYEERQMVENDDCLGSSYFRNINGNPIAFVCKCNRKCLEFTVKHMQKNGTSELLLVVLLISFIFLQMIFNVHHIIIITGIAIAFLILKLIASVDSENLLVVSSLGFQVTIVYRLGFVKTKFIPWEQIVTVFINEVIYGQKVIYFLTVKTKSENKIKLIPLFTSTLPRFICLEKMYNKIQTVLETTRGF